MATFSVPPNQRAWLQDNALRFVRLDDAAFRVLLSRLAEIARVNSAVDARSLIESLISSLDANPDDLRASVAWIAQIAQLCVDESSKDDAARELLAIVKKSPPEGILIEDLQRRIRLVADAAVATNYSQTVSRALSVKGVLGYFEDLNATVELRGILTGENLNILDSKESFAGVEPVASVRLSLDSGFPSQIMFQIGRSDLEKLIGSLNTLALRMDELSNFSKSRDR